MENLEFKILEIEAVSKYMGNNEEELNIACGIPKIIKEKLTETEQEILIEKTKEIAELVKPTIQKIISERRTIEMLKEEIKIALGYNPRDKVRESLIEELNKVLDDESTEEVDEKLLRFIRDFLVKEK